MTSKVTLDSIPTFTVKFGKIARTLDYTDNAGSLMFTFDIAGKDPGAALVLEHWAKATPRDSRYAVAFQRTKEFLESRGYVVEIWEE
jgi:hypothetical protein